MNPIAENWYSQQSGRRYPIDDGATAQSDANVALPADILVDCYLRFPRTLGEYAYVSSVYASDKVISVTFLATNRPARAGGCSPDESSYGIDSDAFTPLATITIARSDLLIGRQYPVVASSPGVGGWVVFGPALQAFSGLFSSPEQSLLAPRVCRAYDPLPVPGASRLYQDTELTGLVKIVGGTDISVTKEERLIEGVLREALVIALVDSTGRAVLDLYRGPCSGRPESGTCSHPGILTVGGVAPDCAGNLTLEVISDCADLVEGNEGTLFVDFCQGLADACTKANRLPLEGKLPNDYDIYCLENDEAQWIEVDVTPPGYTPVVRYLYENLAVPENWELRSSSSSSLLPCVELPYVENFDDSDADYFQIYDGDFANEDGIYKAVRSGHRNLAIWDGCDLHSLKHHPVSAEFVLPAGDGQINAGVVFDFKEVEHVTTYYVVEANKSNDSFRLRFFNGRNFVNMLTRPRLGLRYDEPYAITIDFTEEAEYFTALCRLRTNSLNGTVIAEFSANLARLKTPYGKVGLQAYLSKAEFYRFIIGAADDELHSETPPVSSETVGDTDLSLSSGQFCTLPLSDLAVYYQFNESGSASRSDRLENLQLAAIGSPPNDAGAHDGLCLRITAAGQYLESTETTVISFGARHSFSTAAFVWFDEPITEATLLWGKFSDVETEWFLYVDATGFHAALSHNGTTQHRISVPYADIPLNQPFYICLVFDGTAQTVTLRINGDDDYTTTTPYEMDIFQGDNPLRVVRPSSWMDGQFIGRIDELVVFQTALENEEIDCLIATGITSTAIELLVSLDIEEGAPFIPAPVSFWKLNETGRDASRVDFVGSNYLFPAALEDSDTQIGGVGSADGVLDGAMEVEAEPIVSGTYTFTKASRPLIRTRTHGLFGLSPGVDGFTSFTLAGWINGDMPTQRVPIAGVYSYPDGFEYAIFVTGGAYRGQVHGAGIGVSASAVNSSNYDGELPRSGWRHVALVFDHTTGRAKLYVNGQVGSTGASLTSLRETSAPFVLGGWGYNNGENFTAWPGLQYDDWGFWDEALSADAIAAIYNEGEGWQPSDPAP